MALDKPDTIDFLTIAHDGSIGVILAAYIDDREELETLALIQQKLSRYFDFIESGEVYDRASRMAGRMVPPTTPVRIELRTSRPLDGAEGPRFVQYVSDVCREAGVGFEHRVQSERT